MVLSWHSSGPSSVTQPAPQISTGNFSQAVSPTNLPIMIFFLDLEIWISKVVFNIVLYVIL